jgi:integrase
MARERLDVHPAQRPALRSPPDLAEWKALLREAGVRDARLHDARHTAATTLLLLGVPDRGVMDMMGWSYSAMVRRYSHVTARLRRDIADRLNEYLWETK